ncbi:MAG: HAD family hydrolase [Candidatus Geothermarchaeales archaeon]
MPRPFLSVYKAVLFDVGGTLTYTSIGGKRYPWDPVRILRVVLGELGYHITREEAERGDRFFQEFWEEKFQNKPRGERWGYEVLLECERHRLGRLGLTNDLDRLSKDLVQLWEKVDVKTLFPDVKRCLKALRDQGYRMAVISQNLWPSEYLAERLKGLGILGFFEFVLTSESAGYDKPDPRLFSEGLNTLEVNPGEAVYVGNEYKKDVVGAREAGMTPILIDRERRESSRNCITIQSLTELPATLESTSPRPAPET